MIRRLLIVPAVLALTASSAHAFTISPHPHRCSSRLIRFPYYDRAHRVRWLAGDPGVCFNHRPITLTESGFIGGPGVFWERLSYSWGRHREVGRVSVCPRSGIVKVWPPAGVGAEETAVKTYR